MSDLVMANGDGAGVLRFMRSNGYKGPFILTSGYSEDAIVHNVVMADPATIFLPKPYSVAQLGDSIDTMLDRFAAQASFTSS